jgi:hypothetical protein
MVSVVVVEGVKLGAETASVTGSEMDVSYCQVPGGANRSVGKALSASASACSLGLSATSQQYFSLRTNQPPKPAVLFSQNKPAPAISHQPTEQAVSRCVRR